MIQETWRLLDLEYPDPCMNLAVEEAISMIVGRGLTPNTVRFWRNRNAIVLGRSQDVESEVNFEACRKYGTSVVKRFTGGGAVYQDLGNLNYAISIRRSHALVSDDILRTNETLLKGVVKGLEILGIKPESKPSKGIFVDGEKISGIAGAVKQGVFFHHGTLLINSNLTILSEILYAPKNKQGKGVRSIPQKVTTLEAKLGRKISVLEVKEALRKGFERAYNVKLLEGKLMKEEEGLAEKLLREKYTQINISGQYDYLR